MKFDIVCTKKFHVLLGVSTHISPEIQVQTYSLSFIFLPSSSTRIGEQTLSSHLGTILQSMIVDDGDWVSSLGDVVVEKQLGGASVLVGCSLSLFAATAKSVLWISCLNSLSAALVESGSQVYEKICS